MHVAAHTGHLEILTLLCQLRSDLSAKDKNGYTPLLAAAAQGHYACVEALLRAKASAADQSPEGSTALHFIVRHPVSLEQRELFVRVLGQLTALSLPVDVRNALGETPLHQAAVRNRWLPVRTLLNMGADVNAVTKAKDTPLHYAAAGHVDAFRELLRRGADPTLVGQHGTVQAMVTAGKQTGPAKHELVELIANPPKRDAAAEEADEAVRNRDAIRNNYENLNSCVDLRRDHCPICARSDAAS